MSRAVAPVISIVVIAHSVRAELERCFASIAEHAALPYELILVDNASTDGTLEWVSWAYPNAIVIPLDRNMGAGARSYGLRVASGRFTAFLDSDTELTRGALPAMVRAMESNPDWGLLGPKLTYADGSLQLSCRRLPPLILPALRRPPLKRLFDDSRLVRRHLMADIDHRKVRRVPYVIGACQLFPTAFGRAIGPYDERVFLGASDIDWCIRCWRAGRPVLYFPNVTVVHRYRQLTTRHPLSKAALGQLTAFYRLQWKYRNRALRRELARVGDLDEDLSYLLG